MQELKIKEYIQRQYYGRYKLPEELIKQLKKEIKKDYKEYVRVKN